MAAQPEARLGRAASSSSASETNERCRQKKKKNDLLTDTLAFMFETRFPQHLTRRAAELETLQEDYPECWAGLKKWFNGKP